MAMCRIMRIGDESDKNMIEDIASSLGYSMSEFVRFVFMKYLTSESRLINPDQGFSKGHGESISVKINVKMKRQILDLAHEKKLTMSRFIRALLKKELEQLKQNRK